MTTRPILMAAALVVLAMLWTPTAALNIKLSGINYDFRQGPDWDTQRCKPNNVVAKEMKLLQTLTNRVRIYSLSDCNVREVLRSAATLNMTVWLGVWVDKKKSVFLDEVSTLRSLIGEKLINESLIDGINVGSEALYRNDTTPDVLIDNFNTVKKLLTEKGLNISMSITDTLGKLYDHPEIVEVQDIVTFNQFPFWNKIPIDSAMEDMEASIDAVGNLTKSKPMIITETGWPAGGFDEKASEASPSSAAQYMKEFVLLAEKKKWKYYYFAGFDTPYRKTLDNKKDSVEAYFGIFNKSGKINTHYDELDIPVKTMVDGPAIPINKTAAPTTSSPSKSGAVPLDSSKVWLLTTVLVSVASALL